MSKWHAHADGDLSDCVMCKHPEEADPEIDEHPEECEEFDEEDFDDENEEE